MVNLLGILMTKKSTIAERIKAIRKALNMSQAEFAKELGMSTSSISEMEAANYKPTHDFFYNIGLKLNANLYYLFYGKGEMFTKGIGFTDFLRIENLVVDREEFIKMLKYCDQSPLVQYLMLGHFRRILRLDSEAIQQEIEENKANNPEK
jgi:transcriptional regulator with XRE-family HTH domain